MAVEALKGIDYVLITPQAVTNTQTTTARLDCKGAEWASIRILFAAELNTNAVGPNISVLESDDTTATNAVTIVADRATEDITAAKEVRYELDLRKRKRYVRLKLNTGTATNDTITVAAIATTSRHRADPASTTAMGDDVVTLVT